MKWQELLKQGYIEVDHRRYCLIHLLGKVFTLEIEESGKHARISIPIMVEFTSHCVSFGREPEGPTIDFTILGFDRHMLDHRGVQRAFCFDRYRWSHQLPRVIGEIAQRKCFFTGRHNYVVLDVFDDLGKATRYEIFFDLRRHRRGLRLEIESAYVRTRGTSAEVIAKKWDRGVRFKVLAAKIFRGEHLRAPMR